MQKVRVTRYVAGKKPEYAHQSDSSEDEGAGAFASLVRGNAHEEDQEPAAQRQDPTSVTADPRLARLQASAGGADARTRRRVREAEVEGGSESESEEEGSNSPRRGGVGRDDGQRVAEVEGGSESEAEDEEEIDRRRALLRARAKQRLQEQEVIAPLPADLGFGEDGPRAIAAPLNPAPEAEESEEESSEYESYTDSEEELQPLAKPVFVSKSDRQTIAERDNNFERDDIA